MKWFMRFACSALAIFCTALFVVTAADAKYGLAAMNFVTALINIVCSYWWWFKAEKP